MKTILIKELSNLLHTYAHEAIDQDKVLKHGDPKVRELDEEYVNKAISLITSLDKHEWEYVTLSTHHGWEPPEYLCKKCGKRFKGDNLPTESNCDWRIKSLLDKVINE